MFGDIAPKRHVALAETPHFKHDCAEFDLPGVKPKLLVPIKVASLLNQSANTVA